MIRSVNIVLSVMAIAAGACFVSANRSRDGGFPELSARENLSITQVASYWHFPFIRRREEKAATKQWYERLQVRPRDAFEEQFVRFSGGNQQKIIMGRWLQRDPMVFLLNEPTQGVDVGTKTFIHQLLLDAAARGSAVVVSSADHEELATICDRVVIMRRGQVMRTLWGSDVTTRNISHWCLDATRDEVTI
jgi:ribose transport system ATP-binding protein